MIIKVDVKVAGDDEFMRCGSSRKRERIEFIQKHQRKVWRRWKTNEDDRY